MAVTGHRSIAASKTYRANSFVQKRTAAQAFSISGSTNQDHLVNRGKENVEIKREPRSRNYSEKRERKF